MRFSCWLAVILNTKFASDVWGIFRGESLNVWYIVLGALPGKSLLQEVLHDFLFPASMLIMQDPLEASVSNASFNPKWVHKLFNFSDVSSSHNLQLVLLKLDAPTWSHVLLLMNCWWSLPMGALTICPSFAQSWLICIISPTRKLPKSGRWVPKDLCFMGWPLQVQLSIAVHASCGQPFSCWLCWVEEWRCHVLHELRPPAAFYVSVSAWSYASHWRWQCQWRQVWIFPVHVLHLIAHPLN